MSSTAAIAPEPGTPKTLDANRYATKKTIAQGMLDIALLTANASQLKYVLQAGSKHEFYSLMVGLISTSIVLQATQAIIYVILTATYSINTGCQQRRCRIWNNIALSLNILTTIVNVIIRGFDAPLISSNGTSGTGNFTM
ncbi:ninjurin-1-like isoform X1 [Schistocerca americana]|uniref:ninjurin-1-like isoform X1 n=1 Tax=Schistocerca americana TaxID=7009 RepID=UPI001F4FE13A|nr:ninjurin-1-like isoform X1 [Schistocerca americana]